MKPIYILLAVAILACAKPKSTVSGNAYWNYNKYVGDKPDAGTSIYLFSSDTSKLVLKTECDVQGNFQIDNVEIGDYTLVAESKNTNASASDIFYALMNAPSLGVNLKAIDSTLFNRAFDYHFKQMHFDIDPDPFLSTDEKLRYYDSAILVRRLSNQYAESLLKKIPDNSKLLKTLGMVGFRKLRVFSITVEKNKKTVQVIDFGNTYM